MLFSPMAGCVLGSGDASFVMAEWTQEGTPVGDEPMQVAPLHRHFGCDEAWYVLEGELCVQVDGETFRAPAGSAVLAPKRSAHTYWNPLPVSARYLLVMTPKTSALIDAIHSATDRSWAGLQNLFREFDAELI